ncbi:unnamed protein product [Sympodiomycopsis kandeliae]
MASSSSSSTLKPLHRSTDALSTSSDLLSQFTCPLSTRSYSKQYATLYDFRLRKLRKSKLISKATKKFIDQADDTHSKTRPVYTPRILDVQTGVVTFITGIVYLEMKLKPDVLQELTREQYLPPLPPVTSYSDPESDTVYVEDESGRLQLVGPILTDPQYAGQWITGTVGAFLGTELENGHFHVLQVCWPGLTSSDITGQNANKRVKTEEPPQEVIADDAQDQDSDQYAVLVSGLHLGDEDLDDSLAGSAAETRLALLSEWISGEIGDQNHREKASRIAGLVIAGNSLSLPKNDGSLFNTPASTDRKNNASASSRAQANLTPNPASILVSHLVPLSSSLPIILQPGASDPCSTALPQQPLHPAILPGITTWSGDSSAGGIQLYTNPSYLQFNSCNILSHSGQSIDDLSKYTTSTTTRLQLAKNLLKFSLIAPTCPDTLSCYPFTDSDPFIIDQVPDVLCIGNQPNFETDVYHEDGKKVRVLLLSTFAKTGEVALLNLRSKKVRKVVIGWHQYE